MEEIIMLGTGAGRSIKFYNACFALKCNEEYFLVDGGGGVNILAQLKKANIPVTSIKSMFVTHNHIDHIIGIIWIIRELAIKMRSDGLEEEYDIYASDVTIDAIRTIAGLVLTSKLNSFIDDKIRLHVVGDREKLTILGQTVTFYDVNAKKEKQFGIRVDTNNGKKLVCNGDESLDKSNFDLVQNVDFLIHEAFCLESEKEQKKPHKKGHGTAKDICEIAEKLNVKNLILYHISSDDVEGRQESYLNENKSYFSGKLYIPNDLDRIQVK